MTDPNHPQNARQTRAPAASPSALWSLGLPSALRAACSVLLVACGVLLSSAVLTATSASAFDLKDTEGRAQKLSAMKGKWVVVNFWATWCAPCVKEIPEIATFAKTQAAKVNVIGIAIDWDESDDAKKDAAKLIRTANKFGHKYPLVLSDDNTEKVFGKIKGMPTTLVYSPDGKLVWSRVGPVTDALLTRVVNGEKP
jgi:thiol-disulfide isomerase/thioredoxin